MSRTAQNGIHVTYTGRCVLSLLTMGCFRMTLPAADIRASRAIVSRCVLCRERVIRLKQTFNCSYAMRLPLSVSQYSMTSSVTSSPDWDLPSSSSLYSVSSGCSGTATRGTDTSTANKLKPSCILTGYSLFFLPKYC